MKIAILNDTHCGVRNASEIYLNNAEQFYNDVFFPKLEEEGIKHILHLGDYYDHRKFVNFKALTHSRKYFLNILREKHITMDIIPGNHDVYYKNTNELNSLKECLGHYMNEVNIIMEPEVKKYGSLNIALLPWICAENYEHSMEFVKNCKADWLGGHLELKGFEVLRGLKAPEGMDPKIFNKFEMVLSGHYHCSSRKDNIWYLGSQLEFTWNDAHDPKYFHIVDTETREITKVLNPHTLYYRIYYDDKKKDYQDFDTSVLKDKFVMVVVVNKTDGFVFDKFIDRIQNEQIHELKIAENFNEFMGDNVDDEGLTIDDTFKLMDDYIDNVNTELDKDRIKTEMRELMNEAQSLEFS
tara:strand:+ start:128 stop:1189 length:1062 start_codon:yes stop_codon:yes gene_type:complete